ncbi:MXAN_6577-like cysteine-rich protein [Sorangium sp. So ce1036]|uniref:MXAN_6577-like cysteine-rich protein n=1 Tax=Sorangium sp. So ce1036 TaxID=3133328 RepID=UPI003EFD5BDE
MEKLRSRFRLAPTYTLLCLAAAVLAPACSGGGATTNECMSPTTRCDSGCVDLSADASNCGQCGNACATGETCSEGACVAGCEDGQTACGGECVDTGTSAAHCGECGNACEDGQICEDGACQDAACEDGRTRCGDACVDVEADAAHCGECDNACEDGQTCEDGTCVVAACEDGLTACGDACVDLQTDAAHCGECGTACGADQTCVAGACEGGCGSGLTACGDACIDAQSDEANCGGCGVECSSLEVCQTGACACTVSPGADLGDVVPQVVNNTTVGAASTFAPSCVATSSSERVYMFTARTAGRYSFDTSASTFNTVVALLDATGCSEIACNADPGAARVSRDLAEGQTVYVVVDGADGETGAFQLSVTRESEPSCPAGELSGTTPQTITGSTRGRPNSVSPTQVEGCLATESRDSAYTFTAQFAGDYTFDTYGSTFDTVLHVHDATCRGAQIACNDDDEVRFTEQSELTVTLAANQTVVVVVDGNGPEDFGDFTLTVRSHVELVCDDSGVCGDGTSGCVQCAFAGNCKDELAACTNRPNCDSYVSCFRTCNKDQACEQACREGDPESAAIFDAALACAYCDECRNSCGGTTEVVCP